MRLTDDATEAHSGLKLPDIIIRRPISLCIKNKTGHRKSNSSVDETSRLLAESKRPVVLTFAGPEGEGDSVLPRVTEREGESKMYLRCHQQERNSKNK